MKANHTKRIAKLQEHFVPIEPHDSMSEAGRKILLADFIRMLSQEAGSRTGEDIESVHNMRVATRRMRSAFRLLAPYFKPKVIPPYQQQLRKIARVLGEVRDLEVMIDDLTRHQEALEDDQKAALQSLIDDLSQLLTAAREDLIKLLDSKEYRRFVKDFAKFLTTPDGGIRKATGDPTTPYQVRHLLPTLVYSRLGAVKAFDTVLEEADMLTLHALRIEFKRLRYTVSFFTNVLGTSINGFIDELKAIQDHLGRLNDIGVARETLEDLLQDDVSEAHQSAIQNYLEILEAEQPELIAKFPDVWEHFNTRTVQRKLSDSLLILR